MLAAPLKISKEVSWDKPLQDYMRTNLGGESVLKDYVQDIQRLTNARKRAVQITVPDDASLEAVKKYLSLLQTVSLRFPSLRGGDGKAEWRQLAFSWSDAFRPKSSVAQTDITFEQACLLFNLGALESLAGIKQDMKTPESLKIACQCFTRSASYFACLERGMERDESKGLARLPGTLTSDLSPEGLGMLKNLMLAQAQYCCLETAIKNELKVGALAKVASQVTKFYDASLTFARNVNLAKVLDPAWANHIEFHKRKNESMCAYYSAQSVHEKAKKTGAGYGEYVAWLTKAEGLARSAWEWATKKGLPGGVIVPLKTLLEKVQGDLSSAIADNNQIYFQQVPDMSALPMVDGHIMVKPGPIEDRLLGPTPSDDPIFKNLLVPWIRTAEQIFQSKLSDLVKTFGNRVLTRTSEVREGLAEAGLPAAVESGSESESGVPPSLWKRISEQVLAKGGVPGLQADASENKRSNGFLLERIRELELDLNTERDADEAARAQSGTGFPAQPSRQLTANFVADITQFRSLLNQGKVSDDAVLEQFRIQATYLDLLGKTREELNQYLPDVKGSIDKDPGVERVRNELMVLLVDLGIKVQECEAAQTQLVEATSGASIVEELEMTEKGRESEVINRAMDNLKPLMGEVESKLSSLNARFSAVLEKNHTFAALRTQNEATKKREQALAALHTAVQRYQELTESVREGAQFYSDLATRIEQLRVVIQDFCFVRNVEREEFAQSRQSRSPAASVASDIPAAPIMTHTSIPQRPPPFTSASVPVATPAPNRPAPHRPAPQPPSVSTLSPAFQQTIVQMKEALGLYDTGDDVLATYVTAANGDLNIAIDKYFANPPPSPTRSRQPSTARGGWFQ